MTDPRRALGHWPNAPLALVIAQIRYEPAPESAYTQVADRLQLIGGALYPNVRRLQRLTLSLGIGQKETPPLNAQVEAPAVGVNEVPEATEIGIDMRNADNTEAILIHKDAFTYMTSAYIDSGHLAAQWEKFMGVLFDGKELRVTRLGLRYVDFITPSEGHVPEDYLQNLGKSPEALGKQAPVTFSFYDYPRTDGGRLRLQYLRGEGSPELPPDLQDAVTVPAKLLTQNPSNLSAVLDMDRWRPFNESINGDTAADALIALREDLAGSFRSIITELASNEWTSTPMED